MKHLILLCAVVVSVNIYGQTELPSLCDKYRTVMTEGMNDMGFDSTSRKYIIGFKGEYFNAGMSDHFSSEPKVPEFMLTDPNINPHMVKIVTAHVDLYHCDVIEKALIKENKSVTSKRKSNINNEEGIKIFPNPTSGIINLKNIEFISSISIFNLKGGNIRVLDHPSNQIDITDLPKGIYFLSLKLDEGYKIEKIVLE